MKKRRNSQLSRIERKCDFIITSLVRLRATSQNTLLVEKLRKAAISMAQSAKEERKRVEREYGFRK